MRALMIILGLALPVSGPAQTADTNLTDSKGLKQGRWIKRHENGNKRYEGSFRDDKPRGIFTYFYEDAPDVKQVVLEYEEHGTDVWATYYHKTGSKMAEGKYLSQKKTGMWKFYDDKGIITSEDEYSEGKKNGKSRAYFLNGKLAEEKQWRMDVQHGRCMQYFDDGKTKFEGTYVDGNLDGKVIYYYPGGNIKTLGYYRAAVKSGIWQYFMPDGKEAAIETYRDGALEKQEIKIEQREDIPMEEQKQHFEKVGGGKIE